MDVITWVISGITLLFFAILLIKSVIKIEKICAICVAVSLTWIVLLVLYFLEFFYNKIIIAVLMGMTALGIYYLLEEKIKKELTIFRLPFLLTLVFIIYTVLESFSLNSLIFLAALWAVFLIIYLYRKNKNLNILVRKIVECCKKW